jgi:beta-phosphoglucomutase-like phosphatase (HAD superfamily)
MTRLIFDMDGTMIDSMPYHAQSWVVFCEHHGIQIDVAELLRAPPAAPARMHARAVRPTDGASRSAGTWSMRRKQIYRELFAPVFAEVPGFKAFAPTRMAWACAWAWAPPATSTTSPSRSRTSEDGPAPHAMVGGDEGLPGKPEPAIFLEAARRIGAEPQPASCSKMPPSASKPPAAPACAPWHVHQPHAGRAMRARM